ncbi:MAG: hypothetical protein HQK66_04870, partial [Desulfamplus sp.]|nr:hypothetical protein [Desulfamplus sp.]
VPEPEKGIKTLGTVIDIMTQSQESYEYAKKNLEKKISDIDRQLGNWDIKDNRHKVEIEKATRHIELLRKDLERLATSIEDQKEIVIRLGHQIKDIHANTEIIKGQRNQIADIKESEIALLMYSNIIQQNIDYAVRLEDRRDQIDAQLLEKSQQYKAQQLDIRNREVELEDLKKNISRELELTREELERQSDLLKSQYTMLTPLRTVQKPMASLEPVKPDKLKIMALALVMGIFCGIMLAFLVEFYVKYRDRLNAKK